MILLWSVATLLSAAPVALFNERDLKGWHHEGPRPSFFVEAKELRTSGRAHTGNWLRTASTYEDFRLTFEYKIAQWAEAAVILRAPRTARPQTAGISIFFGHDFHKEITSYTTGGVMGIAPPKQALKPGWGEWHRVSIELHGDTLRVRIDEIEVQNLRLSQTPLKDHLRSGYIGFPDMGYGYALRKIEVEDLGHPTRTNDLLAKRTLDAWTLRGAGNWRINGDIVEGSNGHGILYAPQLFHDFELAAVIRTHSRTNSGIFLRGDAEGPRRGFEVQVYSPVDAVYPTGSIYGIERSSISADLEDRWFLMQIRVQGTRCTVWVDGVQVAESERIPETKPGRIGLQIHLEDSRVEFRDLLVREIDTP